MYRDVNGVEIHVGDAFVLVDDQDGEPEGATGRVIDANARSGQVWTSLLNLDGTERKTWYVDHNKLAVVPIYKEGEEEKIEEQLCNVGNIFLSGGKAYTLNPFPCADVQAALDVIKKQQTKIIKRWKDNYTMKEAALKAELDRIKPMPNVTLDDVRRGMRVYKGGSDIVFLVPMHYAPTVIYTPKGTFKIPEADMKELCKEVFLGIRFEAETGTIMWNDTFLDVPGLPRFLHYHHGCLGDLKKFEIKTPQGIWTLRDKLQEALKIINSTSLANKDPWCIVKFRYENLEKRCLSRATSEEEIHSCELREDYLPIGSDVKILSPRGDFPANLVGKDAVVVATAKEYKDLGSLYVVELNDAFPGLTNGYGFGHLDRCWLFERRHLELIGEVMEVANAD